MESSPQSHRYISLDNVQMSDLMAMVQGNVASGLCGFKSVETVAYLPSQKPKDLIPTDTLGWQIVMGAIPLLYFGNCCVWAWMEEQRTWSGNSTSAIQLWRCLFGAE